MRRPLVLMLFLSLSAITAGAMAFMFMREKPQWTTSSREALAAFEQGLADEMKMYQSDALQHYARALELDPSFAMARVKVAQLGENRGDRNRLLALLSSIDTSELTELERKLIEIRKARAEGKIAEADAMMDEWIARNPRDPHVLSIRCNLLWGRRQFDEARSCNQRLLDVDPNWVTAVNQLGYISMAQGRFDEAAEHFMTYRYIAPDQANPHDSTGELLMLRGEYAEAEKHFRQALDIRPDFCASWTHLVQLNVIRGEWEGARADVERIEREPGCSDAAPRLRCQVEVSAAVTGDEGAAGRAFTEYCADGRTTPDALLHAHREALAGRDEAAAAVVQSEFARITAKNGEPAVMPFTRHVEGIEHLVRRDPARAAEMFAETDRHLAWFGDSQGVFKLYNRAALATALARSGNTDEAARLTESTRPVNPSLYDEFTRALARLR